MPDNAPVRTSAISALYFFAWINLLIGLIAAIITWVELGQRPIFSGSTFTEVNPIGIMIGFIFLTIGVSGCALLIVICEAAGAILETRNETRRIAINTERTTEGKSSHTPPD